MEGQERGSHRRHRNTALGCGLLAVLAVLVLFSAFWVTGLGQDDLLSRWDRRFGTWEENLARWPAHDVNGPALELERRAAGLGIDLAPRDSGRSRVTAATPDPPMHAIRRYVTDQLESPVRRAGPTPEEVVEFLATRRAELDRVYETLESGPEPRWQRDLGAGVAAPIPNLLGHLELQKTIFADALAALAAGETGRADRALEASWRLNGALREEPILIDVLIALAAAQGQAGVVRLHPRPDPVWMDRWRDSDYTGRVVSALAMEGRSTLETVAPTASSAVGSPPQRIRDVVMGPYIRACAVDSGEEMLERLTRLAELDYVCDRDLAAAGATLRWESPWWNTFGDVMFVNLSESVHRAARTDFALQLTARMLEIRRAGAIDPAMTAPLPACPEVGLTVASGEDGAAVFGPSRPLRLNPNAAGPRLPESYPVSELLRDP